MGSYARKMPGEEERMYGNSTYWEDRYQRESEDFEWYQSYENIKDHIKDAFPDTEAKILNVGNGTSRLPAMMYTDGYKKITSIDFSGECIKQMSSRSTDKPELEWLECDARDMSQLGEDAFDYAIDKGTMDSILCGANSTQNVYQYLKQIKRVLKKGGTFLVLSYRGPKDRDTHFKYSSLEFTLQGTKEIDKPQHQESYPVLGWTKCTTYTQSKRKKPP